MHRTRSGEIGKSADCPLADREFLRTVCTGQTRRKERRMVRRSPLTPEARLLADQLEARRLAKSRARIAKLLAKQRGDLKRMPLSGKAILAAIRTGKW